MSDDFTLPAAHALQLAAIVKDAGVPPDDLFAGLGVDAEALVVPGAQISVELGVQLFERARRLTREPAVGIQLGLAMSAAAHGYLGFAAMTAPTLREALETASRFIPTRTNALSLAVHVNGPTASLVIEERADFGVARDAILFWVVIGLWQLGSALTGQELEGTADLPFDCPEYFARFAEFAPEVRFGQPITQLLFDSKYLDLPLTMADAASRQIAYSELERSLGAMADADVVPRVRKLVLNPEGGIRSLEDVAGTLGVSPRTLKRRLAGAGATYSDLLEEERREMAFLLLRTPDSSIDAVAERLGYSDPSNFRRAFQRWTGVSPAAYRKGRTE